MADALKLKIRGTFRQIRSLGFWDTTQLARLVRVDYYKLHMIPEDEVFIITQDDIEGIDE